MRPSQWQCPLGGGDRGTAGEDVGALDFAAADAVSHLLDVVLGAAAIAHRGQARVESGEGVCLHALKQLLIAFCAHLGDDGLVRVESCYEMDVGIDQTRNIVHPGKSMRSPLQLVGVAKAGVTAAITGPSI